MPLLATLIADESGIVDIYRQTTYGGGLIPRDRQDGGLAFSAVLGMPVRANLKTYERAVILLTGGFAD